MPPTIQAFMNKLTANERMALWGAVIVVIASIFGSGWLSLIGAIVVIVVYWLKYSPTSNMTWPAPVQLITLAISALIALFAVLGLLGALTLSGFGGLFFGGIFIVYLIAAIATAIGAVMMLLGTWREYQAMPKSASPTPPTPPAPPAA
jgi:hypothetical protein